MKPMCAPGLLVLLLCCAGLVGPGCAMDNRTGKALADALADGPIRDYASAQADVVAQTGMVLHQQVEAVDEAAPDLGAAQASWRKARAAYDRAVAVFLVVAPDLDLQIDGGIDDPLATTGLHPLEAALFSTPPAPLGRTVQLTQALRDSAVALHVEVPQPSRQVSAADLVGSLSAVAAAIATKLDGSFSPYAGASLLSVQSNLTGLSAVYTILSPLVQAADPALDQQITGMLRDLLGQVDGLPALDAVADKTAWLRECAHLALAFKQVGTALQLAVTTINLS